MVAYRIPEIALIAELEDSEVDQVSNKGCVMVAFEPRGWTLDCVARQVAFYLMDDVA